MVTLKEFLEAKEREYRYKIHNRFQIIKAEADQIKEDEGMNDNNEMSVFRIKAAIHDLDVFDNEIQTWREIGSRVIERLEVEL